jgi:HPt (histidine-containing phosphotransfer) domain-containing protein
MTMQEQLRALVHRHHANFAEQISALHQLLAHCDRNGLVAGAQVIQAQVITHQMKGTAGSMGFVNVGIAAAALDTSLKNLKTVAGPISTAQLQGSLDLLDDLRRNAQATTPEMSTLYNVDLSQLAK